jgi:hypothetical protein
MQLPVGSYIKQKYKIYYVNEKFIWNYNFFECFYFENQIQDGSLKPSDWIFLPIKQHFTSPKSKTKLFNTNANLSMRID